MAKKPLESYPWNLEEIFKNMYVVPVYQRPYSWEEKEMRDLLDDLWDSFVNKKTDVDGLFTGTIFLKSTDEKVEGSIEKYEIIDGQQRIASFSLILLYLYHFCNTYSVPENDKTYTLLKNSLWKEIRRENRQEYRVIEMSSLESKIFMEIFDENFRKPLSLVSYVEKYKPSTGSLNGAEKRVIKNFSEINLFFTNKFAKKSKDELLDYIDYLLKATQFIAIEVTTDTRKVFDMFESINSKGRKLEDIDLIKTYIFSKLEEDDYKEYLKKWGDLIIKTDDNLYDYFYNYVKAYITFYQNNINITNFKSDVFKSKLKDYFGKKAEADVFKDLIDDMTEKVSYFKMLDNCDEASKLVNNKKFRFYYKVFTIARYKHPRALFLRTLSDFGERKIDKEDAIDIVSAVVKFMIKYSSIGSKDSRDSVEFYQRILQSTYGQSLSSANIKSVLNEQLITLSLTKSNIVNTLETMDVFTVNKILSRVILSLFEATTKNTEKNKYETSFDNAFTILDLFEKSFSLDHLLPQNPDPDNSKYFYYSETIDGEERLKLKEGHDFDLPVISENCKYDTFKSIVLHTLGNLRIMYQDDNARRQTRLAHIEEYGEFTTYSDIKKRNKQIVDTLLDNDLL